MPKRRNLESLRKILLDAESEKIKEKLAKLREEQKIRLEKAKDLLKTGNYNVTEVAYMVGFSSQSYFTKSFQKHFGFPPSNV